MSKNKQSRKKIRVLYVAGLGHSGSTLLDLVLASSKNAYGLGELCNFPVFCESAEKNEFCDDDSGVPISDSVFWSSIYKKHRELIQKRESGRIKKLILNIFLSVGQNTLNYQMDHESFFSLIQEEALKYRKCNNLVLIDSSKNILRLKQLANNPSLDVSVIHLVRKPNAAIASQQRKGASLSASLLKWIFVNTALAGYIKIKFPASKRMRLSYENFAKNTEASIKKINAHFGLQIDPKSYISTINKEQSYRFSGNAMRQGEFKGVRLDEKWKKIVPVWKRIFVNVSTFPARCLLKIF